jgi:hypothetical protein
MTELCRSHFVRRFNFIRVCILGSVTGASLRHFYLRFQEYY